ncbi:Adenylate and Guanylate cyclase catalytic domain containing protein [Tritrichomonas foetus]|uniref:Adenylate and Guanylate cyclase catalytic domain containing protein n=1 Tax=Tritrichomonas foetus TaxID=1144522 RepID=A0A1J4JEG7_9EUKA|nr:Adenylate and Guanylate cyclase catalytic domain containing protein [Tritrichomonas foetus]|eukprot:OHS97590.1 Adenylate and Guanylate cyclase catalytic domain containing protein [Tritrichomonas foetus]
MSQIKPILKPLHFLCYLWYFAQLICVSCWSITFNSNDKSFLGNFCWVFLANTRNASSSVWLGIFLFFTCCVALSLIMIVIQLYYYHKTRKFVDWMLQLIRFAFEVLSLVFIIPAAGFIGVVYLEYIKRGFLDTIKYIYLAFMIIFLIYMAVMFIFTYQFLYSSPYLPHTPFGTFNGNTLIYPTIIMALFLFVSCFIRAFPKWSYSIPLIIQAGVTAYFYYNSLSYPFLHMPLNVIFQSVLIGCICGNVLTVVLCFLSTLPEYVPFIVSMCGVVFGIIFSSILAKKNLDKVKIYLNRPIQDSDDSISTDKHSKINDEDKLYQFQELDLLNESIGIKYLRLALFTGSDYLLDESMIKYIIMNTNSTPMMIEFLRIAACFPSMSRLMTALLSKVIVRRDISFRYRFVLYQIERITAIRNTSSSSEMTSSLNDIVNTSSIITKEIQNFWLSVPKDPSIFKKIANETSETNSKWTELLLKYPNSGRLHEEYATFLIEVKTDFEGAVVESNKSSMIELGNCQHLELAFKLLMQNYPFYLKKGIIDTRGNISVFGSSQKGCRQSANTTSSSTSQQTSHSSATISALDNELQLTIARSLFSHSRLRLALQGALKWRTSPSLSLMLFWSVLAMIVCFAVFLVEFFMLINYYDDRHANVERMSYVSESRTAVCYALNYVSSQWALSSGAVSNDDELLAINIQHGGHSTIFLDPMAPDIYNCAKWMRDNLTRLGLSMGQIALNGLDIKDIAPTFLTNEVPFYIFLKNELLEPKLVNFKTLFSYMIYANGYLVKTIDNASNWIFDDVFLTYMKNSANFLDSIDVVYNGLSTDSALSVDKIHNGNMLILIIPASIVFVISVTFFVFFYVRYVLETKKWLKLMVDIEDKYKIEASKTLDPKGVATETSTVSESNSSENSSYHIFSSLLIICLYLILTVIAVLFGIISLSIDNEFINLNMWMLYGSVRASATMESLGYLVLACTLNDTYKFVSPLKSEVINRSLNAITRMKDNHMVLMNGNSDIEACTGYSEEMDSIASTQKCDISQTNMSYHDMISCNSLTQNVALAFNYVALLVEKLKDDWGVKDIELFQFMHLVNKHLFDDLNGASTMLKQISLSILNSFQNKLLALLICGFLGSLLTFFAIFFVNNSLKEEFSTIMQIIRRLPPNALSTSPELLKALMNSSQQQKKEISSTSFAIIDKSPEAIICCNKNDSIELVNPTVSRLLGYTSDQLLGQSLNQLLTYEENEDLFRQIELMKNGESALVYETHVKCTNDNNDIIPCICTLLGMSESRNREISSSVLILSDETDLIKQQTEAEQAKTKSEMLLYQILPRGIVVRLNAGEKNISFVVNFASIIFIDIVAFSEYTAMLTPQEIMGNLSSIFGAFDNACGKYNHMLKIKLIGDVYMAASGIFTQEDSHQAHAEQIIRFGLDAIQLLDEINVKLSSNLQVRIGVNSGGPLIAGVLGTDKPVFDIIGDPINIASRLQSTDFPGHIQIPHATFELISGLDFAIEQRGEVFLKGKGKVMTYLIKPKVLMLQGSSMDIQSQILSTDGFSLSKELSLPIIPVVAT